MFFRAFQSFFSISKPKQQQKNVLASKVTVLKMKRKKSLAQEGTIKILKKKTFKKYEIKILISSIIFTISRHSFSSFAIAFYYCFQTLLYDTHTHTKIWDFN